MVENISTPAWVLSIQLSPCGADDHPCHDQPDDTRYIDPFEENGTRMTIDKSNANINTGLENGKSKLMLYF